MRPFKLDGGRMSIPHFPGEETDICDVRLQGRSFLFVRDLPLQAMPYRSSDGTDFAATLIPADDELARAMAELLDMEGHRPWSLEEALSDFIRDVVGALAYSGELHFELVPRSAGDTSTARIPWQLMRLPPGRIVRAGGRVIQVVPKRSRHEFGKRGVIIPADRIWRVRLPAELGSPRRHRRMLQQLARASDVIPSIALSPYMGSDIQGYDLSAYRFAADAEVENLTKRWGSIPSLQRIDGTTEFYLFERMLQFRRSVALIRERLIDDINGLMERLRLKSRLRVEGLPTSGQIDDLVQRLRRGEIDFKDASEQSRTP